MTALFPRQTAEALDQTRVSRAWNAGRNRPARSGAVGRLFAAIGAGIREHLRRQRVMSELSRLSDRELADIGITRNDISQIFTPEFAAQRRLERGA